MTITTRVQVLEALRTRLLTVAGVGTTWPVRGANLRPIDPLAAPEPTPLFIEELPAPMSTIPVASSGPLVHWRQTTGLWQINLCFPHDSGLHTALAMADAIETAFVGTSVTLTGGEVVLIREVVVQEARAAPDDAQMRIPIVFTYQVTAHT